MLFKAYLYNLKAFKKAFTCLQLPQHFANLSLQLFLECKQFSWDLKLQFEGRITNNNLQGLNIHMKSTNTEYWAF